MPSPAQAAYEAWWACPLPDDEADHVPFTELSKPLQAPWEAAAQAAIDAHYAELRTEWNKLDPDDA